MAKICKTTVEIKTWVFDKYAVNVCFLYSVIVTTSVFLIPIWKIQSSRQLVKKSTPEGLEKIIWYFNDEKLVEISSCHLKM